MSDKTHEAMNTVRNSAQVAVIELLNSFKTNGVAEELPAPATLLILSAVVLKTLKTALEIEIDMTLAEENGGTVEEKAAVIVEMLEAAHNSIQLGVDNLPEVRIHRTNEPAPDNVVPFSKGEEGLH